MNILLCVFYEIQYRRFVLVNETHNYNNGSNDDDANDNNLEPFGENYLQYQPSRISLSWYCKYSLIGFFLSV